MHDKNPIETPSAALPEGAQAPQQGFRPVRAVGRFLQRWWPDTLFARLACILVVGMLTAQFLTSSIWLSVRYAHMLAVPTRVTAERVADVWDLLQHTDLPQQEVLAMYAHANLTLTPMAQALPLHVLETEHDRKVSILLDKVFHQRWPTAAPLELVDLRLKDAQGGPAGWPAILGFSPVTVDYVMQLRQPDGQWLRIEANVSPGWQQNMGWQVLADLLLRVYLLRIAVVLALVVLAVRWVVEPLKRLSKAANALEGSAKAGEPMHENGPQEVRNAAQAFNRMQQRIQANMQERTRFLAAVSHDLRSPITRMRLRLELLDEAQNLAQTKAKLRSDLLNMEEMLDATLRFIQAEQNKENFQDVDMDAWVYSLCHDWCDLGRAVHVSGHSHCLVSASALGLKRMLSNLLDNALQYGSHAEVSLAFDAQRAEVVVCVQDNGVGLSESQLTQMLEPFVRGEPSRNRATGGYGLGLSIVNAIVQGHGGRFHLRNRTDGQTGLEAWVHLPAVPKPR